MHWKIFVVSLPDAYARKKVIVRQLQNLLLSYEFVRAIDGRTGLPRQYESMIDRLGTFTRLGRSMTDAEYACALSHMSIYKRVVDDNLPGAIVLEDDAILSPLFKEFIDVRGYEAGELIQLDHLHGDVWRFHHPTILTNHIRLARAARNASLTSGYSISRSAASYLLRHGQPLRGLADWPCDVTTIPSFLTLPRIVHQDNISGESSVIEAERASAVINTPKKSRARRFFLRNYWRRWWFKRMTKRVS